MEMKFPVKLPLSDESIAERRIMVFHDEGYVLTPVKEIANLAKRGFDKQVMAYIREGLQRPPRGLGE